VLQFGVSQIDAGTKLEIGAYADNSDDAQNPDKEQFLINDNRSLREVIDELLEEGYIPSFCTACYRKGRTGEHFMEFSVPGSLKDIAPQMLCLRWPNTWKIMRRSYSGKGLEADHEEPGSGSGFEIYAGGEERLERIRGGERDLYF